MSKLYACLLLSSPPYEGGVDAVSADGVVLSEKCVSSPNVNEGARMVTSALTNVRATDTENHPPAKAAVPLLRKEGNFGLAARRSPLVTIAEQDNVQLPCNILNCDPESVTMGMKVKVLFEQHEDLWVPFFEPEAQ